MRDKTGFGFFLLVAAGFGVWFWLRPDPNDNALHARELATRFLAEHLARRYPGQHAVVLANPFTHIAETPKEVREAQEAGLRGLRAGFGKEVVLEAVVSPELRPGALENPRSFLGNVETPTPLSYLISPTAYDTVAGKHPGATLLVSLIGLPSEWERCAVCTNAGPPSLALLWPDLRVIGDAEDVIKAMRSGKLAAFVQRRPNAVADGFSPAKDPQSDFDQRFLLVTPENVEQIAKQFPGIF
jgi:hypothetical protein